MQQTEAVSLDILVKRADEIARSLIDVTVGREPDAPTSSNVATFATVASMLQALSEAATRPQAQHQRWEKALHRIANLQVRDAAQLLEGQKWSRIAIEIQAIAQEAISGMNSH